MITALQWDNRIRTNIKAATQDLVKTVTDEEKETYPSFPTLLILLDASKEIGQTLIPDDNGTEVAYKIQVYTNGSKKRDTAKKIMDAVETEMRRMGFSRPSFQQVPVDSELFSYMARYTRPIMQGEEISKRPV